MSGRESQTGTKEKLKLTEQPRSLRKFILSMTAIGILAVTYVARLYWTAPEQADAQQKPTQFRAPQTAAPVQRTTQAPKPTTNQSAEASATPKASSATSRVSQAAITTRTSSSVAETKKLKVVAQVNGENVSRNELAQACLDRYGKETLEGYLNKRLIKQACEKHQIAISEEQLDREIERMAKKFGMSVEK